MSDEEIIKRRLMFDGGGTSDDRRLNVMLKTVAKWVNTNDLKPAENQAVYDKIISQLALCEHSRRRSQLLRKSNNKQFKKYEELYAEYEDKIRDIKEQIVKQKQELEKAQVIKQNRIQYDLLAKSIDQEPARMETSRQLVALQEEITELGDTKKKLDQKMGKRKKQFHVLSTSANMLRTMIAEDSDTVDIETVNNTSLDDITNSPGPEPMSE